MNLKRNNNNLFRNWFDAIYLIKIVMETIWNGNYGLLFQYYTILWAIINSPIFWIDYNNKFDSRLTDDLTWNS